MVVVVCVNPQWRRRWCRDGIPDPGNAAQIAITPELPSASLLCAIEVLPCHWVAGVGGIAGAMQWMQVQCRRGTIAGA